MPRNKHPVGSVTLPSQAPSSQVLISCEHASNAIPKKYGTLGLTLSLLTSHIAWDPGARSVAYHLARSFGCSYYAGKYSRLLVDLNRSEHHHQLIPTHSFGVPIAGNMGILRAERADRLRYYYLPFRTAVIQGIRRIIASQGTCLHLSIHSFTPAVGRQERRADIGLLYDPRRPGERMFARQLAQALTVSDVRVRRNYPYRGTSDGFTTHCRRLFPPEQYLGLEIEVNQRQLNGKQAIKQVIHLLGHGLRQVFFTFLPIFSRELFPPLAV